MSTLRTISVLTSSLFFLSNAYGAAVSDYLTKVKKIPVCSPTAPDPKANWAAAGVAVAAAGLAYDMYKNRVDHDPEFKKLSDSEFDYSIVNGSIKSNSEVLKGLSQKEIDSNVTYFNSLPSEVQSDLVSTLAEYNPKANWAAAGVAVAAAHLAYDMYKNRVDVNDPLSTQPITDQILDFADHNCESPSLPDLPTEAPCSLVGDCLDPKNAGETPAPDIPGVDPDLECEALKICVPDNDYPTLRPNLKPRNPKWERNCPINANCLPNGTFDERVLAPQAPVIPKRSVTPLAPWIR